MREIIPTIQIILIPIAIFYFLFAIFRRLSQDYPQQEVVRMSFFTLILSGGFYYLVSRFSLQLFLIAVLLGLVLVVYFFSRQNDWRFWAVLENLSIPGMVAWLLVSFGNWFQMGAAIIVLLSNLYWQNYRRFSWYPSGKIGFLFLVDLVQFSLIRIGLDFWQNRLIELACWVVVFWLSIAGIIFRAGQATET
jgi:hypothetical protein